MGTLNTKTTNVKETEKDEQLVNKWTNVLLEVIEKKSTSLILDNLSQKDVDNIPWELLTKCTSVTALHLNSFPGPTGRPYQQPPKSTRDDVEMLFPWNQIYQLTNLETLRMSGYPFEYISPKIGQLINLKCIYFTGSRVICLPSEIGKCTKLNDLSHYCSYGISYAPYELKTGCCINHTYISRRTNYIYNSKFLPPLPKPCDMKDIVNQFKKSIIELGLIDSLVDIILDFLEYKPCSNTKCKNKIIWKECIYYAWSVYKPGADPVCLLATMCSNECIKSEIDYGKRYYLALIDNDKSDENVKNDKVYSNVRVDGENEIAKYKSLRWPYGPKMADDIQKEDLNRFEYFWMHKLGYKYKSYQLVQGNQNEIMVTFT